MLTQQQQSNLKSGAAAAVASERQTGVPAECTVAQWAEESGWGKNSPGNNCFGIKWYPTATGRQLLPTMEWFTPSQLDAFLQLGDERSATATGRTNGAFVEYRVLDWFATFPTLADCFSYHAAILTRGVYAQAFQRFQQDRDLKAFITGIAQHYATAPNYASLIIELAQEPEVMGAIAVALQG
jgi:flagellum-specific peptidoglycan hydrolase FlgJ